MTVTQQEGTVIGGWAVAIARAIDHYKLDAEGLFRANRINLSRALDTNARFPVTRISQVLQSATVASGDDSFGLMVAKYIRPTSWHALGISIWASACMEESFQRLIRHQRMFNTALTIAMESDDSGAAITMSFPRWYKELLHDVDMDAIMATVALTGRHIAEGQFRPLEVSFTRPPPKNIEGFERLFRCPVKFSAPANRLLIDRADLSKPLPTRNAELAVLNDRLITEYLARLDRHDVVNQVYAKLLETLEAQHADQAEIARALYLSPRNLQRKLKLAGTSYQEILDQLRKDLVLQYLQQSHLSINEIAFRLGFAKVGSFTRAFKNWTGLSPQQYRAKTESSRDRS
ncbi:AraC family transcriptional regulator [Marinobacterium rhizophilum]|uniref:AraC family transcriptional regulator n=1 Tax=Marinobacterium rhizophilum TaxID=420402 RepID=UPI0003729B74|nr:AraC family transcriptional regulator [Marinobacterium rhizophilum]